MEHFVSIMPRFGLHVFQNASGRDYWAQAYISAGKDPDIMLNSITKENKAIDVDNTDAPKTNLILILFVDLEEFLFLFGLKQDQNFQDVSVL